MHTCSVNQYSIAYDGNTRGLTLLSACSESAGRIWSSTSLRPVDINVFPSETQKPMQLEHSSHILTTSIYLDNEREIGGKQKLIIKHREAYLHG